MLRRTRFIAHTIRSGAVTWCLITFGIAAGYYLILLAGLIIRFDNFPNYLTSYDWVDNSLRILFSTPSLRDALFIIKEEWLIEIGFMNYEFGMGISEWSLVIVPFKVLGIVVLAGMLATTYLLLCKRNRTCSLTVRRASAAAGGVGAGLVSLVSVSMFWIVCCSTPSWVVGLAMMGIGVSVSLWLEPLGVWLGALGFLLLAVAIYLAAGDGDNETLSS